jgi:hypothetical protein
MASDRYHTIEFLARVNTILAEARATRATMAQTDRIIARELVARRQEMLKELCGTAYVPSEPDSISVHLGPNFIRH